MRMPPRAGNLHVIYVLSRSPHVYCVGREKVEIKLGLSLLLLAGKLLLVSDAFRSWQHTKD